MLITLRELRSIIHESFRKLKVVDTSKKPDFRDPMKGSVAKGLERQTADVEDEIEELRDMPEFEDLDAFMQTKMDDDDYTVSFVEVQALARNLASKRAGKRLEVAGSREVETVRNTLEKDMGFKYTAREPPKQVRGFGSSAHGTHPFAGNGGGGSGFGSDFGGPSGTAFGGGPGAMGGGESWDKDDSRNLAMGAKKKKLGPRTDSLNFLLLNPLTLLHLLCPVQEIFTV